jgi:hypothetical protein
MPFLIITIQVELTPNGYDSLDVAVIASFKMPSIDEEGNVVTLDGFVGKSRGMLKISRQCTDAKVFMVFVSVLIPFISFCPMDRFLYF